MTNLELKRPIPANALFLLVGQAGNRAVLFLFLIVVARLQGDAFLGQYSFATTFIGLLFIVVSFGLERTLLREVSRKPETLGHVLRKAFGGQLLLWILSLPLAAWLALYLGQSLQLASVIWVLLLWVPAACLYSLVTQSFQGMERMEMTSALGIISALQLLFFGSLVLLIGGGLMALAVVMIWERLSTALIGLYLLHRGNRLKIPVVAHSRIRSSTLLKISIPFVLLNFMGAMHQHVDVLIMPSFVSFNDIGQYSTAYRILEAFIIVPAAIASASFPEMARSFKSDFSRYQDVAAKSLEMSLVFAGFIVGILFLFAEPLIVFAFGQEFVFAAVLLKVLIWGLFFQSVNNTLGRSIIAVDLEWFFIIIAALALISNLALNVYLLPRIGVFGAAIATLGSYTISTSAHIVVLQKKQKMPHYHKALLVLLSFVAAAAVVFVLQQLGAWEVISFILGSLVYTAFLLHFKIISRASLCSLNKIGKLFQRQPT